LGYVEIDHTANSDSNSGDWANCSIVRLAIEYFKVMVIEETVVIAGSLSFAKAAEQNQTKDLFVIWSRTWQGFASGIAKGLKGMWGGSH
jgi:hypothetical protein